MEPVPGGAAGPPATGNPGTAAAVRGMIRSLPWRQKWPDYVLDAGAADELQAAILAAMARSGVGLDQVTEVARHAMAEGNWPVFVKGAFSPSHFSGRLRRLTPEPVSSDPLPLPASPRASQGPKNGTPDPVTDPAVTAGPSGWDPPEHCKTCDAKAGDPRPWRTIDGPNGAQLPCPDCLPAPTADAPGKPLTSDGDV